MIQINCIGLGSWGPNLVRSLVTTQRAKVGVICDLSTERLDLVRRNISSSIETSTDPHAAAADPRAHAVVNATPTHSHFALARTALENGKHVFVEKPLSNSMVGVKALVDLA